MEVSWERFLRGAQAQVRLASTVAPLVESLILGALIPNQDFSAFGLVVLSVADGEN